MTRSRPDLHRAPWPLLAVLALTGALASACGGDTATPPPDGPVTGDASMQDTSGQGDDGADTLPGDDDGTTLGPHVDAQGPAHSSREALAVFVLSGGYQHWRAEPAVHASAGPHGGNVRTFVNDTLFTSLQAGASSHPAGSVVVKELYGQGTDTLTGYAVDVKEKTSGGDTQWVFWEGFLPNVLEGGFYFRGTQNLCGSCHEAGSDYVLTDAADLR